MTHKKGDIVKEIKYGFFGIIDETFENWEDLKSKNRFPSIDPDNKRIEMSEVEKIINGDPKDDWINAQEIPFTDVQLGERWHLIKCFSGGSVWACESCIEKVNGALN
jgi:hypothetical protein